MRHRIQRARPWLALVGVIAAATVLLPPVVTLARQYSLAQAAQFAVLGVVVPALVVLGAPWRIGARRSHPPAADRGAAAGAAPVDPAAEHLAAGQPAASRLADRLATVRSHRPGGARAWLGLAGYLAVVVGWRLPVAVNTLVRHPLLNVAQAITLIAAGCALWLELVESPPFLPRASRPQRAALAALPMWTIWASAYIMGFSRAAWFSSLARAPGHGLSTSADQQIAAGLLWVIPGLCFVPVVYFSLITWLRDSADPDDELREVAQEAESGTDLPMPRPPRGWRSATG